MLVHKHFFNKRGAKLSAAAFHKPTGMLVAGFSNGIFELCEVRSVLPPPPLDNSPSYAV